MRNDTTIKEPIHHTVLLHQKEKWKAPTGPRLLTSELMDYQKSIPLAPNPTTD